jgi:hypothetical protein
MPRPWAASTDPIMSSEGANLFKFSRCAVYTGQSGHILGQPSTAGRLSGWATTTGGARQLRPKTGSSHCEIAFTLTDVSPHVVGHQPYPHAAWRAVLAGGSPERIEPRCQALQRDRSRQSGRYEPEIAMTPGSCWWATTTPSTSRRPGMWSGSATPLLDASWTGHGIRRCRWACGLVSVVADDLRTPARRPLSAASCSAARPTVCRLPSGRSDSP